MIHEWKPNCVVCFVVGGTTYEEALAVRKINVDGKYGANVILGGTTVLNSRMFINALKKIS